MQPFIASWMPYICLTAAKLTCPCNTLRTSNSFARSETGLLIDSEPHLSCPCKTSLLFAPLAVRVFTGCSAFTFYTPTKPLILLHIRYKNSKWVWSGNTTITNCRQTRGIVRKGHITITKHQKEKQSKATNSLIPIEMIAKLKWTQSNAQQNIAQLQNPTMGVTLEGGGA